MIEKQTQKQFILHDNLWKVMMKLSLPAIVAMVLHGLNTIFDAIFVGNFVGEVALSGVSIAYPLTQISIGFGSMIGGGAGAYLSIALGENNKGVQKKILGNVHYLTIITTAFLMIVLFLVARPLIGFMGGEGEALEFGVEYFRITVFGTLLWILALSYNMVIRAEGKMGVAALIMGTGLAVNIIVNYIFMGILDLGVAGAAWGTNIGMLTYSLFSLIYFNTKRPSFPANIRSINREKSITKNILSMGMPSLIMSIMALIQGIVILNAIGAVGGDSDIAFYGVTFRIYLFMMTPLFALMRSLQPVVGINFGARQFKRVVSATKVYIMGALVILVPGWIILMAFPQGILGLMLPGEISASNVFNYRIILSIIPLLAVTMNTMSYFPSINEGKTASIVAILRQAILYIPAMIILPRLFGVGYVYIGSFAIDAVLTVVTGILLVNSFKKLRNGEVKLPDNEEKKGEK